jgi:hypothetical protein
MQTELATSELQPTVSFAHETRYKLEPVKSNFQILEEVRTTSRKGWRFQTAAI